MRVEPTGVSGREDRFTKAIEEKTARLPSSGFLGAAVVSMALSAVLKLSGKEHASLFVGQWAAPFLLLGIYNKMVKQHGSEGELSGAGRGGGAVAGAQINSAM